MANKTPRSKPASSRRIPDAMTDARFEHPSVCFYHFSESSKGLEDVPHAFFVRVVRQCKLLASMSWEQVYAHKGLGWDEVPTSSMKWRIPSSMIRESLNHFKISRRERVWGYREGNAFQIVWFDPNHEVTPD